MKKILLIALAFIATSPLFAQNFTTGGINYSVTSATAPFTVMVTTHSSFTGAANIPSSVTNAGTTYSVNSIGYNAFKLCTGLTSVSIPTSVTSIGYRAFYNCTALTLVNIPTSVTNIGSSAFYNCAGLTSVSIPGAVTSILDYTFFGCTGLSSVSISVAVTSIGTSAFYGCTSLTSVSIPATVNSMGWNVFNSCTSLTSITVNWATPLAINPNVFLNITLSNVALTVPAGSLAAYQAAAVWNSFYSINGVLANDSFENTKTINLYPNPSNGIFNFQLANDLQIEVYNNLGQLLSSEKMLSGANTINISDKASGVYFLKANDGNNESTYKMIKN